MNQIREPCKKTEKKQNTGTNSTENGLQYKNT